MKKNTLFADFCADQIDVITDAVMKRVYYTDKICKTTDLSEKFK